MIQNEQRKSAIGGATRRHVHHAAYDKIARPIRDGKFLVPVAIGIGQDAVDFEIRPDGRMCARIFYRVLLAGRQGHRILCAARALPDRRLKSHNLHGIPDAHVMLGRKSRARLKHHVCRHVRDIDGERFFISSGRRRRRTLLHVHDPIIFDPENIYRKQHLFHPKSIAIRPIKQKKHRPVLGKIASVGKPTRHRRAVGYDFGGKRHAADLHCRKIPFPHRKPENHSERKAENSNRCDDHDPHPVHAKELCRVKGDGDLTNF